MARQFIGAPEPMMQTGYEMPIMGAPMNAMGMGSMPGAPFGAVQDTRSQTRRVSQRIRRQSASLATTSGMGSSFGGGSSLVAEARRFIGTNPTGRSSLWCARFMNMVLTRTGHQGTSSDMARSFASYGHRLSGPQVGAIAVMSRGKGGGHVGVVSGIDDSGNPIVISGNHGRHVGESVYSRSRIYAYVMP